MSRRPSRYIPSLSELASAIVPNTFSGGYVTASLQEATCLLGLVALSVRCWRVALPHLRGAVRGFYKLKERDGSLRSLFFSLQAAINWANQHLLITFVTGVVYAFNFCLRLLHTPLLSDLVLLFNVIIQQQEANPLINLDRGQI